MSLTTDGSLYGSSPHVRGARSATATGISCWGIIPACAGSTTNVLSDEAFVRDHPRMCGEHAFLRGRQLAESGSSPHVRGARVFARPTVGGIGIIPACAGSTEGCACPLSLDGDHPRMCGEHICLFCCFFVCVGSSPHVRGARRSRSSDLRPSGIIPACAGSTNMVDSWYDQVRDHPRMCGEHATITR